jgi:hypothetical protein
MPKRDEPLIAAASAVAENPTVVVTYPADTTAGHLAAAEAKVAKLRAGLAGAEEEVARLRALVDKENAQ